MMSTTVRSIEVYNPNCNMFFPKTGTKSHSNEVSRYNFQFTGNTGMC